MKRLICIASVFVISLSSSCNKKAERAAVARGEVATRPDSSKESSAIPITEPTPAGRDDLEFLKPMYSCPVGKPGFLKRPVDSLTNVGWKPLRNALYHYSIGEDQFFTKHWQEAILAFEKAKDLSGDDSSNLRDLIDFKIMLCVAGLGMDDKFEQLASMNLAAHGGLLSGYTKAAKEFHAGNDSGAREVLATIKAIFPNSAIRAPWEEAMDEFGYTLADIQEPQQAAPADVENP